jgi:hypothetical protein
LKRKLEEEIIKKKMYKLKQKTSAFQASLTGSPSVLGDSVGGESFEKQILTEVIGLKNTVIELKAKLEESQLQTELKEKEIQELKKEMEEMKAEKERNEKIHNTALQLEEERKIWAVKILEICRSDL